MFVDFKKIKFKNILSYGNNFTEIDFHSGLNLIKAQNGSGKSTILDAINFCLFGKPFRNIKMAQLINKYNQKDLEVRIEFKIGNDEYEIARGLKPTMFELKKNGEAIDSLSSKKLNQEEIDKLIGINERLFKNIVGIAVTNNKPFLSMSIGDKRALIESIFNIDVLSEMGKEVKKRNTADKTEQRFKLTEMNGYKTSLEDNESYIQKITTYIEQFDEKRNQEIEKLEQEINSFDEKIKKKLNNINVGNKKINELMQLNENCPSDDEIKALAKNIGIAEHDKKNIEATLKTIGTNKYCPICNSELDEGHAAEHIKKLKQDLENLNNNTIPNLRKLEETYNEQKNKVKANKDFIQTITDKVKEEIFNKTNYENSIKKLKEQIEEIKNKKCEFTLDEYNEKITDLNKKIEDLNVELEKINHKIEIDNKLIDILGDEGLRMYFFRRLIPVLNQKINHYLKKFELNASIEFDNFMNETIMTGRFEQQYNQFSGGERSRIDMAILLAFFDISKIISNWSCSLLFVDEVLDAGVDQSGTEQFLSTFYNIVTEESKDLGIYIISHKLADVTVNWHDIIEINKKSLFSELSVK